MAQTPQLQYQGVITSIDSLKQRGSYDALKPERKRQSGQFDVDLSSRIRGFATIRDTESLSVGAESKRPRLDLQDVIEASEIYRDTK